MIKTAIANAAPAAAAYRSHGYFAGLSLAAAARAGA
jgi:hypothetical protein